MSLIEHKPIPEHMVFSEIVREIFGEIIQYEDDVPQDFKRPCFLFINPSKNSKVDQLTKALYKETLRYEIYGFANENDVDGLYNMRDKLMDYLIGTPKIKLPETEQYFTIENIEADTNYTDYVTGFMIEVSRLRKRNLKRVPVNKISTIINRTIVDGGVAESVESSK